MPADSSARTSCRRGLPWRLTLLVLLLAALAGAWFVRLSRQPPDFWVQTRQWLASQPPNILEDEALGLEQRVLAALQPLEQEQASQLTVTQRQANAWVHCRLRLWLEHFGRQSDQWWPPQVGEPIVRFRPNEATVAWGLPGEASGRIWSASLRFQKRGDAVVVRLAGLKLGRMALPGLTGLAAWALAPLEPGHPIRALLDGARLDGLVIHNGQWTGGPPVRVADVRVEEGVLRVILASDAR